MLYWLHWARNFEKDGLQKKMLFIEIGAMSSVGDVAQPNIIVTLVICVNNRRRPRGTTAVHHVIPINVTETTTYLETPFMCQFVSECQCQTAMRSEY